MSSCSGVLQHRHQSSILVNQRIEALNLMLALNFYTENIWIRIVCVIIDDFISIYNQLTFSVIIPAGQGGRYPAESVILIVYTNFVLVRHCMSCSDYLPLVVVCRSDPVLPRAYRFDVLFATHGVNQSVRVRKFTCSRSYFCRGLVSLWGKGGGWSIVGMVRKFTASLTPDVFSSCNLFEMAIQRAQIDRRLLSKSLSCVCILEMLLSRCRRQILDLTHPFALEP